MCNGVFRLSRFVATRIIPQLLPTCQLRVFDTLNFLWYNAVARWGNLAAYNHEETDLIYYRVEGTAPGSDVVSYYWETTQKDEKAKRKELSDKGYAGVAMTEMDIPTDKPSLTKWLQENVSKKE
jgi:hypothetical protein